MRGLTLPGHTRRTSGRSTVAEFGWLAPPGHPEFCFEPLENSKLHSSLWKTSAAVFLHGAAVAAARPSSRGSILVQSSDSLQGILAESLKGSKGGRVISEGEAGVGMGCSGRFSPRLLDSGCALLLVLLRIHTIITDYCGLLRTAADCCGLLRITGRVNMRK